MSLYHCNNENDSSRLPLAIFVIPIIIINDKADIFMREKICCVFTGKSTLIAIKTPILTETKKTLNSNL